MVKEGVYFFVGEDAVSKERKLRSIKRELNITKDIEDFNYTFYEAKDLKKDLLKERLLQLPQGAKKILIFIRRLERASFSLKEFLVHYVKEPFPHSLVVLDTEEPLSDEHLKDIAKYAFVFHFRVSKRVTPFDLARATFKKNIAEALRILTELIEQGQRETRLLSSLIFYWQKKSIYLAKKKEIFSLFLKTDIDIKLGRIKPKLALELLLVRLCSI